jgi:transposase
MTAKEQKRTYFPSTTASQRRLLFHTWEETGNVTQACRKARVSRGTFYKWKPRFEADGYAGLECIQSRAPKHPHQTPIEIREQVIKMRREHPLWGKRRIADELAKGNQWVRLVSPNTVKRILKAVGLWTALQKGVKKRGLHP